MTEPGRGRKRRAVRGKGVVVRRVAIVFGGSLLAWFVGAVGVAAVVGAQRPATALLAKPFDAFALTRQAEMLVIGTDVTRQQRRSGETLVLASLARDAAQPAAWRTLAIIRSGEGSLVAPKLLAVAGQLSRRDIATQLGLIEDRVARGDVAGALIHYDIALRTAPRTDALLLPILVTASADPNVRVPLASLLVRAPDWRRRFFDVMAGSTTQPAAYESLLAAMRRHGPLAEADIHRRAAGRFAQSGQTRSAWRVAALLDKPERWQPLVRNGNFTLANDTPPLDWALDAGGAVEGTIGGAGSAARLTVSSVNGDAGRAAHQLLRLAPGARYKLSLLAGPVPGQDPTPIRARVLCGAVAGSPSFAGIEAEPRRSTGFATIFRVPTGCGDQTLEVGARIGRSDAASAAWITNIAITPIR